MTPLRLCVVGAGSWSTEMHLPALTELQQKEAVCFAGVCDLDRDKASAYARRLGAEAVFTDVAAMLSDAKPDGLILIAPTPVTPTLIRLAIQHRVPFFTEKPPAPDSDTHRALIREAADLLHVVGYNRRHSPYALKAREWLAGCPLQSVTTLFSRYRRRDSDFTTTAVHAIDTTRFLGADACATVHAEARPSNGILNYFVGGWLRNGARFDILITPDTASAEEHYILRTTERTVFLAFPHRSTYDAPGFVELREGNRVVQHLGPADFGIDPGNIPALAGILGEHTAFVRALQGGQPAASTLAATLETQEIRERLFALLQKQGG